MVCGCGEAPAGCSAPVTADSGCNRTGPVTSLRHQVRKACVEEPGSPHCVGARAVRAAHFVHQPVDTDDHIDGALDDDREHFDHKYVDDHQHHNHPNHDHQHHNHHHDAGRALHPGEPAAHMGDW